jgi:FkbM family methyltransferase
MNHFKSSFLGNEILLSDKCNSIWGASRGGEIYDEQLIANFYNSIMFNRDRINFFDIGSNTGSFIFLPLLNSTIHCYAFEPNPKAYEALSENIKLNGLENNVYPKNIGVWNEAKELELKIPVDTTDSGLATFGNDPTRFMYDNKSGEYTTHIVQCKTIDELFVELGLESLDVIKIDTEGSELNILKGGEKTIREFKPAILLEFDNKNTTQFGYMRDDIVELLRNYGYSTFKLLAESDLFASPL